MFSLIKEMGWVLVRCKGRLVPFARVVAAALWLELDRLRHALTQTTLEADLACLGYPGHMDDYQDGKIKLEPTEFCAHDLLGRTGVKIPKPSGIGIPQRSGHTTANPLIPTSAKCNGQFEEEKMEG